MCFRITQLRWSVASTLGELALMLIDFLKHLHNNAYLAVHWVYYFRTQTAGQKTILSQFSLHSGSTGGYKYFFLERAYRGDVRRRSNIIDVLSVLLCTPAGDPKSRVKIAILELSYSVQWLCHE